MGRSSQNGGERVQMNYEDVKPGIFWERDMSRHIEGCDRRQSFLLHECVDDYVTEENLVRVVEAFIDELD